LLVAALTLPRLSPVLFVPLPRPSPAFDCDDAALATYQYFADMGVESRPIIGNLDMTGEAYDESNHVWLLVRFGDKEIAYDWGWPHFDAQHYEGYPITLDNLLYAVSEDSNTLVASAGH
jgi:hypothetical protein